MHGTTYTFCRSKEATTTLSKQTETTEINKESAHCYTPLEIRNNQYELDHIYEVPQYGDRMKPNDYEHYYEPIAANWFICYVHVAYKCV